MLGAEDDTRGADAIYACGMASQARNVQGETETDSRWRVNQNREASAGRYQFTFHARGTFFVSLTCKVTVS